MCAPIVASPPVTSMLVPAVISGVEVVRVKLSAARPSTVGYLVEPVVHQTLSSSSRDRTIEGTSPVHKERSTFQLLTFVLVDNLARFRQGIPRIVLTYDRLICNPVVLVFFLCYCPVLTIPIRLIVCREVVSFVRRKGAILMSAALV